MAEAAQAEASAAVSPTDIKKEPNPLEGFDFSMSPEIASKRPLENVEATIETPDAKRLKTENAAQADTLNDDMSLIFQNALSNINELMGQFDEDPPEEQTAQAVAPTTEPPATDHAPAQEEDQVDFLSDPVTFVRNANTNTLGNIAISMLLIFSQTPFDELLQRMRDPKSEHRHKFQQLQKSLEAVRVLFSSSPVLLTDDLRLDSSNVGTIFRFANLAQLGSWLQQGGSDSLHEAGSYLPTIFRDEIIGLPKRISDILVGIKTQAAIQALQAKEDKKLSEAELKEIFIEGMEQKLHEQNIANQVINSNQTVTDRLRAKMEEFRTLTPEMNPSENYPPDDLLRNFIRYVKSQLATVTELGEKLGVPMPAYECSVEPGAEDSEMEGMDLDDLTSFFEKTASGLVESALADLDDEKLQHQPMRYGENATAEGMNGTANPEEAPKSNGVITDYKELEALVAESTSNYVKTTLQGLSPTPYQPTVPTSTTESMAAQSNYMNNLQHHPQHPYYSSFAQAIPEQEQQPPAPGQHLPPNQSCSSAMLYEKARQAALSRQTAHTRREGLHSTRRPWSQEEEKALMTGLDMVKGPHWSQILGLFGPHGTVSDILKDRTQVQLKDKARNLKLFFLKTNSEMPYYLNTVTGELKTRAPTQAARKEAEERARLNSEEDQAKLQGIMALAGGLQHQTQNRGSGSPAAAVGSGVVTPAQAAAQAAASGQHRTITQASGSTTSDNAATSTTESQNRPQPQATSQQVLQSMPHPPPRPQNQLPPQTPRPQPQPQQTTQQPGQMTVQQGAHTESQPPQQYGQQPLSQKPQQPGQEQAQGGVAHQTPAHTSPPSQTMPASQPYTSSTPTPAASSGHQSPALPSSTPQPQHQQAQQTPQSPAPSTQVTQSSTPALAPAQTADPVSQAQRAVHQEQAPDLDSDTEAALIRDLQTIVTQATSSSY